MELLKLIQERRSQRGPYDAAAHDLEKGPEADHRGGAMGADGPQHAELPDHRRRRPGRAAGHREDGFLTLRRVRAGKLPAPVVLRGGAGQKEGRDSRHHVPSFHAEARFPALRPDRGGEEGRGLARAPAGDLRDAGRPVRPGAARPGIGGRFPGHHEPWVRHAEHVAHGKLPRHRPAHRELPGGGPRGKGAQGSPGHPRAPEGGIHLPVGLPRRAARGRT